MKITVIRFLTSLLLLLSFSLQAYALTFQLPTNGDNVVGYTFVIKSLPKDTLRTIGRRYDIGFQEMRLANQDLSDEDYLIVGSEVVIPARFILPDAPRNGIVVNLPEFRLYYYPQDKNEVLTFPVGIGKDGWETPTFTGKITLKKANPEWNVPKSVREYNAKKGIELPRVFPPGPNNPLGQYAFFTTKQGYLIHGTNRPLGVGDRVSSGCLRLAPENIEALFLTVPVDAPLRVLHQPFKAGRLNHQYYLQAYPILDGYEAAFLESQTPVVNLIYKVSQGNTRNIDWSKALEVSLMTSGAPYLISGNNNDTKTS